MRESISLLQPILPTPPTWVEGYGQQTLLRECWSCSPQALLTAARPLGHPFAQNGMMPALHTSSSSTTTLSLLDPPIMPRHESHLQAIILPQPFCNATALLCKKEGGIDKVHLKESRRGSIKVCRDLDKEQNSSATNSTQETSKRHAPHRRCPELLNALLQPPQLVQDAPGCAYIPVAMGTGHSTQSKFSLSFFTPKHH